MTQVWIPQVHFYMDFFFIVYTTVLHDLRLVESSDVEPKIWRPDCKITSRFSRLGRVTAPNLLIAQGSTVAWKQRALSLQFYWSFSTLLWLYFGIFEVILKTGKSLPWVYFCPSQPTTYKQRGGNASCPFYKFQILRNSYCQYSIITHVR